MCTQPYSVELHKGDSPKLLSSLLHLLVSFPNLWSYPISASKEVDNSSKVAVFLEFQG